MNVLLDFIQTYGWLIWLLSFIVANFFVVQPIHNFLRNKTRGSFLSKLSGPLMHFVLGGVGFGGYIWFFIPC